MDTDFGSVVARGADPGAVRVLRAARRIGILFLHRHDDAAQQDALAGEEDGQGGQRGEQERGLHDAGAGALLELVEPDHQGPHLRILADEQGVHEVRVGDGKGLEAFPSGTGQQPDPQPSVQDG